jgi:hypothetical protein
MRYGEAHCRLTANGATFVCARLRKPWRSQIYFDGNNHQIGYFSTAEQARSAHADAVREHLGEQYLVDRKPVPGVSRATWAKRPGWQAWRACPRVDGRRVHLGYFQTQVEAAAAVEAYLKSDEHVSPDSGPMLKSEARP